MPGEYDINSIKLIVPPILPAISTATFPASTMFDMVMGVDTHLVNIPAPPGAPIPTPMPHPAIGIIFDAALMLPPISIPVPYMIAAPALEAMAAIDKVTAPLTGNLFTMGLEPSKNVEEPPEPPEAPEPPLFIKIPTGIGASVLVNSMARTNVSTKYKQIPPHIPMGLGFTMPTNVKNGGHAFMGSMTVSVEGNPMTFGMLPCTSCQCIGKPDEQDGGMSLPTTIITPLPKGPLVLVGGPPVPVLSVMDILKGAMKFLKKAQKKKWKKLSDKIHEKLGIKSGSWLSKIICSFTGHPVDVGTGYFYTNRTDIELPAPIPFIWERDYYSRSKYNGPLGKGWHHAYDLSFEILPEDDAIALRLSDGRQIVLPILLEGESFFDADEKIEWQRDKRGYFFTTKDFLHYRFEKASIQENKFHLSSIENLTKHKIQFFYSEKGTLHRIIDAANRELIILSNAKHQITQISLSQQNEEKLILASYQYDENDCLVCVKDALNFSQTFQYRNDLMIQETDRNGLSFYFEYDGITHDAKCIKTWGDNKIYYRSLHYYEGHTIVTNAEGHKTEYFHNQGVVHTTIDANGGTVITNRDNHNNIIEEIDAVGNVTSYVYDERGNELGVVLPNGTALSKTYQQDHLTSSIDALGGIWQWHYNEDGTLASQIDPVGNSVVYTYQNGLINKIENSDGLITQIEYNLQLQIKSIRFPDGNSEDFIYDELGNCTEVTNILGNKTFIRFDAKSQAIQVNEPDGNVINLVYDAEGNQIEIKDKQRHVLMEYAGMGKLTSRKEAGHKVQFFYNQEEQLLNIINEQGSPYRFKLDPIGQVVEERGFDGLATIYRRDNAGRVTQRIRSENQITNYLYDSLGNVTKVKHHNNETEVFTYNNAGMLMEASNEFANIQFERDAQGRIINEIQNGVSVESSYDHRGNRVGLKSSLGLHIDNTYNQFGQLTQSNSQYHNQTWQTQIIYDKSGMETLRHLPGGIECKWERDSLGRLIKKRVQNEQQQELIAQSLNYTFNSRIKSISHLHLGTTIYNYDEVGNLIGSNTKQEKIFREADEVGNYYETESKSDRKYEAGGKLVWKQGTSYEYDAEGNLIKKKEHFDKVWQYSYYANGMLKEVIRPDKKNVSFTYDALGRRLSKTFDNSVTRWVWDGNKPLHEWQENNEAQKIDQEGNLIPREKLNFTTWLFEEGSFVPFAKLQNGKSFSIITDHLGTPIAMLNQQGEKVWEGIQDIYGRITTLVGHKEDCPFRYQGQYADIETGLYYNRFRYYDSNSGCYLSQDPIGLAGGNPNFYAYVKDSNGWVDPFGLSGITYLRTDPYTGKQYVGKSKSTEAFNRRQSAHNSTLNKANPDGDKKYDFEVLQDNIAGKQNLSLAEENWIRDKGGIAKDGGQLENKIHAMADEKYKDAGGTKNKVKTGCH